MALLVATSSTSGCVAAAWRSSSRFPAPVARHIRPIKRCRSGNDSSTLGSSQPEQQPQQQQPHQQGQQQQQQPYPPGYDPKAAAGFMPAPGEKPLWWVEKFEQRRLQLAEEQAAAAAAAAAGGTSIADTSPTSSTSSSISAAAAAAPTAAMTPQLLRKAALQVLRLLLVVALLILWPASLYPGGLTSPRIWLLFWCYSCFFAGGSVFRLLRYGPLTARKKDAQGKTRASTAAWVLFVAAIPCIHFPPVREFFTRQQQLLQSSGSSHSYAGSSSGLSLYDVLGGTMLAAALGLNWWAARALGRAYDRVVEPEQLVTDGPYALLQHPIYTSYTLLFAGYALVLHSGPTAVFAVLVCGLYYRGRAQLEAAVLSSAFGEQYQAYRCQTKMFVPFVW